MRACGCGCTCTSWVCDTHTRTHTHTHTHTQDKLVCISVWLHMHKLERWSVSCTHCSNMFTCSCKCTCKLESVCLYVQVFSRTNVECMLACATECSLVQIKGRHLNTREIIILCACVQHVSANEVRQAHKRYACDTCRHPKGVSKSRGRLF